MGLFKTICKLAFLKMCMHASKQPVNTLHFKGKPRENSSNAWEHPHRPLETYFTESNQLASTVYY